jgi:hypothetical protein
MGSNELVIIDNSRKEGQPGRVTTVKSPDELWKLIMTKVYESGLVSVEIYEAE